MSNATQTIAGDIQLSGDLGGSNSAASPQLSTTGVTPGAYSFSTLTVDAKGRITTIADATLSGEVSGTFDNTTLSTTGVVAGNYTYPSLTVDAKGRITSAQNGSQALTGEVGGTFGATTLSTTGVVAGSYTNATITVNSKGRITAATNGVTTLAGDVIGGFTTNQLSTTGVVAGTYYNAWVTVDAKGRITSAQNGSQALTGEVGGSFGATTLSTTGVVAGSYTNATITVDTKGRVTSASSGSIAGVPDGSYTVKGIMRVQESYGLTVTDGVLSGTLATNTVFGMVKSANTDNIIITAGAVDVGSNIPKLNTVNTFQKTIRHTPFALTSGVNIAVDLSNSNVFTLTLGTNGTLSNPSGLGAGRFTFIIKQDATGSRTLAYGTAYVFPSGADKTLSTAANSVNILSCICDGTKLYCSLAKNFV